MSNKYIIGIVVLGIMASCTPDPSQMMLENYNFSIDNNNEDRLLAGDTIDLKFSFQDYSVNTAGLDSVRVAFDAAGGGGNVSLQSAYINAGDTMQLKWQLGEESVKQVLRGSVYDLNGNYMANVNKMAYGFRADQWDAIDVDPDGGMKDMVSDPGNNLTLMISDDLYRQGENYFNWNKVESPVLNSVGLPRTVDIDNNGVIYISTWKGEMLKSTDHAQSWTVCTKPYPDREYYFYNYVSNDNSLWAFVHNYPVKRSVDGGETWSEPGGNLSVHGLGDVFRLSNGKLLYHGSDCCSLYMSDDDGVTWTHIPTPGNSHKLFVTGNDEILIVSDNSRIDIYLSTDYGASFEKVHGVSSRFGTSMLNTFNRYDDFWYVLIPGYGILKTYDLVNYERYWYNDDLLDLFIDHNGVLIAKDWDYNTVYYRNNTE